MSNMSNMSDMGEQHEKYTVILFYKYTKIANPEALVLWQKSIGTKLSLSGRVLVAHEGMNGTLEGTSAHIEEYCKRLREICSKELGDFSNIDIKESVGGGNAFPKLRIRLRKEIVSLGLNDEDFDPNEITGTHLRPEELKSWYENKKDFVVVDMRNDFEYEVGRFKNSVNPDMAYFRDLPKALPSLEHLKDKTVLTVCTGGVRCEKASGYLKKNGFKDVYQLDGGMHRYMEKYPGEDFQGALYTFDNRIVMDFGSDKNGKREVVGKCHNCQNACETFSHCGQSGCHKHLIVCKDCLEKNGRIFCKLKCKLRHFWCVVLGKPELPVRIENQSVSL